MVGMDSSPPVLLACDNCLPGDASPYYLPLAATVVASVLIGVLLYRRSRIATRGAVRLPILVVVCLVCLCIVVPASVAATVIPIQTRGVQCGNAIRASLERGIPNDDALDRYQRACKDVGTTLVRSAVIVGGLSITVAAASGLAAFGLTAGRRRARIPA
jgi:hypothetical protein